MRITKHYIFNTLYILNEKVFYRFLRKKRWYKIEIEGKNRYLYVTKIFVYYMRVAEKIPKQERDSITEIISLFLYNRFVSLSAKRFVIGLASRRRFR